MTGNTNKNMSVHAVSDPSGKIKKNIWISMNSGNQLLI